MIVEKQNRKVLVKSVFIQPSPVLSVVVAKGKQVKHAVTF